MALYGLVRGVEWVSCPHEHRQIRQIARLPQGSALFSPEGEALWLPNRKLVPASGEAWVTRSLEVAIARRQMLATLAPGLVTVVRAVP